MPICKCSSEILIELLGMADLRGVLGEVTAKLSPPTPVVGVQFTVLAVTEEEQH